jgi:hypothetical protein
MNINVKPKDAIVRKPKECVNQNLDDLSAYLACVDFKNGGDSPAKYMRPPQPSQSSASTATTRRQNHHMQQAAIHSKQPSISGEATPSQYMIALCVCKGLFLVQPLLRRKENYTAAAGFTNSTRT